MRQRQASSYPILLVTCVICRTMSHHTTKLRLKRNKERRKLLCIWTLKISFNGNKTQSTFNLFFFAFGLVFSIFSYITNNSLKNYIYLSIFDPITLTYLWQMTCIFLSNEEKKIFVMWPNSVMHACIAISIKRKYYIET